MEKKHPFSRTDTENKSLSVLTFNRQLTRSTRLGSKPRSCLTIYHKKCRLITSEGLLNAPGPSNANEENVIMETSSECTNEDELLGHSDIDDYIPPSQQPKSLPAEEKDPTRHTEKGTCPESLQYRARAKIRADNDFKLDIKRIRKDAEQEVLKALTRFHQREIDRYRIEIKKSKRPRISEASNLLKRLLKQHAWRQL